MKDYPAAHSMDTTWYAVDECGHIAQFNSYESGAVPNQAYNDFDYGMETRLADWIPLTEFIYEPSFPQRIHKGEAGAGELTLFLTELDIVKELIDSGAARRSPAPAHMIAVTIVGCDEDLFKEIHERELCLSCTDHYFAWRADRGQCLGLYVYLHELTENTMAGPYTRSNLPLKSSTLDLLPANLREQVSALTFKGCFADSSEIQPIEHSECRTYGSNPKYLGLDGELHDVDEMSYDDDEEC